jgi:hypothetical protein
MASASNGWSDRARVYTLGAEDDDLHFIGKATRSSHHRCTEEMNARMDKYFRIFPKGVCNTTSSCKRLENGGGSFSCNSGASCDPGQPSTSTKPAVVSHIIFSDVETGIGVGFDLFMSNTDMHLFKMYGGQVYAAHAILGAATSTGWD